MLGRTLEREYVPNPGVCVEQVDRGIASVVQHLNASMVLTVPVHMRVHANTGNLRQGLLSLA